MENIAAFAASNIANVTANVAANIATNFVASNNKPSASFSFMTALAWIAGILLLGVIGYAAWWFYRRQQSAPAPPAAPEQEPTGQTWCYVGTDIKGRHCVQVPSAASCDPERTFTSNMACSTAAAL